MDAKVTMAISDMVSGITMAHDGIERTVTSGAIRDRNLSELIAARDYILAAESQIAERDAQIAEMRTVTGPKCPECDHFLKTTHIWSDDRGLLEPGSRSAKDIDCEDCLCIFTVTELLANHPLIAAELGLEANDANQ